MSQLDETPEVEILTLEEVRAIASGLHAQPGTWNWSEVARLCATVLHWKAAFDEAEADRVRMDGAGKKLAGHFVEKQAKNARLSALVARMRAWVERCRESKLYAGESAVEISAILADPDGQHAAEELRLLREWEAERINAGEVSALPAWQALRAFREKSR